MSQRIAEMVDVLRTHDTGLSVFGAVQHEWRCEDPASEAELSAFEERAAVKLPADYRTFVEERWASGAGPYYGLAPLPEPTPEHGEPFDPNLVANQPLKGAVPLADQGCGMTSLLVLTGPSRGQVWFDARDNGGGMWLEAPSFDAWMSEWLDRALVEAAAALLPEVDWDSGELVASTAAAVEKLAADHEPSPTECQYPLPPVLPTLGYLRMHQGRFDEALAIFDRAADKHPQDRQGRLCLERARVERARGALDACLEAARAGLEVGDAWFATRAGLFREVRDAAFGLDRFDDALAACEGLAEHTGEVQDHLMVAWHCVMLGNVDRAADWIIAMANDGVGCDPEAPLTARVDTLLHGGFLEALSSEEPAEAAALEERLRTLVGRG
jgi:tetratricopeptide (TPR) repeat protein